MDLNNLRKEIDKIDDQIVELFLKRMEVSKEIAEIKKTIGKNIFDGKREQEVLDKVSSKSGEMSDYIKQLYKEIMRLSKDYQTDAFKPNIVLIGMPGAGKTTIAEKLSVLFNMPVVETDKEVEKIEGKSIPEIFEQKGENYFRKIEKDVYKATSNVSGKIISTGGGAVKDKENIDILKQNGRIYYIMRDVEKLATVGRPLSSGGKEGLYKLFENRKALYENYCDVKIQNDLIDTAAKKIMEDFNAHFSN
ncbi:chorismate mutase [Criibacterium bergeronii]|uniref:Shikimate kinase n=1 Tax=Criibacterium bergeronii TaxID=1871336 RepID=A0A552VBE7_9FIRM|nr:chorismate mutase [Criibacterium bergeronii]TRW27803.1 chorismate mutase [Criibacterium bergeronii]